MSAINGGWVVPRTYIPAAIEQDPRIVIYITCPDPVTFARLDPIVNEPLVLEFTSVLHMARRADLESDGVA